MFEKRVSRRDAEFSLQFKETKFRLLIFTVLAKKKKGSPVFFT